MRGTANEHQIRFAPKIKKPSYLRPKQWSRWQPGQLPDYEVPSAFRPLVAQGLANNCSSE